MKAKAMRPVPARIVASTVTVAIASIGFAGLTPATAAGASTPSAQAEYNAALKAAGHQSVHFESLLSQGGVSIHVSGDSGATSGAQTITVTRGSLTEHVKAMVVGKTGYINANATALRYVVGLSAAQASKYAGKWLFFPTSSAGLAQLVAGLENSQVASELQMTGPFSYGPTTTVQGQRARAIRGFVTGETGSKVPVVLYVAATGVPTPIQEVTNPGAQKGSPTIHGTVTLSNWGQQITQTAPAHAASLLKLNPPATSGATSTTAG
jgi:hypothetical protein